MQRSFEDTPCRPPACPSLSIRQPFQGTPWLPSDQDRMQKYEVNMPVDLITEPVSQLDDKLFVDKSVRPKRTLQAAYAKPVSPLAVSRHQEDNSSTPSMQFQPKVHVQATANPPQDLPVIIHMPSASSIQPTTLTTNSQVSMHSNVVTIQTPLALANGLPNDMPHSPNYLYKATRTEQPERIYPKRKRAPPNRLSFEIHALEEEIDKDKIERGRNIWKRAKAKKRKTPPQHAHTCTFYKHYIKLKHSECFFCFVFLLSV